MNTTDVYITIGNLFAFFDFVLKIIALREDLKFFPVAYFARKG